MSKRYPGGILRKTPQTPSQTSAQGIWDMASVTQAVKENNWPIAGVPDPISKSLRFRASASAYLNRTATSTVTDNKKLTVSYWVKRGRLSTYTTSQIIMYSSGGDRIWFDVQAADTLSYYTPANYANVTGLFRDPSAWYHIVMAIDTTQATAANRVKVYVNGSERTVTGAYPTLNQAIPLNTASQSLFIGSDGSGSYFDGYLAEVNFIDGQALTPSSFGGTNDQTGVWQPIAYTGTYGTNGFYLPFSNTASTSTLGYDFSGNSNNWTTNNISLTSGTTYDSMVDVPTQWIPYNTAGDTGALFRGNYCVMNPNDQSLCSVSNGNLAVTTNNGGYGGATRGTIGVSSGKWYWETQITANGGSAGQAPLCGIMSTTTPIEKSGWTSYQYYGFNGNKQRYTAGSLVTNTGYGSAYTTGDIIGVALDMDSGTLTFYKNNVSQGTAFTGITGTYTPSIADPSTGGTTAVNFGQQPFSYTPPAGFKTLCTTNLSTPTIGATASSQADNYFDASLFTGTSSNVTVSGVGFQPDFVWLKSRSAAQGHGLYDAVRGGNKVLQSNTTGAELTITSPLVFNSDGFTSTTDTHTNGYTYVAWQWRASNATGVTNTAGSITSTVSANTTAGFSIVTYTGTGSVGTVGHGLGVAPSMIIVKRRSTTGNWPVYHISVGNNQSCFLNLTNAVNSQPNLWNSTTPTSSVFTVGTDTETNQSTQTLVAYCFAQVAGYSAFGSYTGNGSSDGPFVFLGFKPKFILIRRSDAAGGWKIYNTSGLNYNPINTSLETQDSAAEATSTNFNSDWLSNGFKLRTTYADFNTSGGTYIYMAFAESPFKYALAR